MTDNRYVELVCGECLIRIKTWESDGGRIDVQVISNPSSRWHMLMGTRIKNAWRVLRGHYDWSGFELMNSEEADEFIAAIAVASCEAFPEEPK